MGLVAPCQGWWHLLLETAAQACFDGSTPLKHSCEFNDCCCLASTLRHAPLDSVRQALQVPGSHAIPAAGLSRTALSFVCRMAGVCGCLRFPGLLAHSAHGATLTIAEPDPESDSCVRLDRISDLRVALHGLGLATVQMSVCTGRLKTGRSQNVAAIQHHAQLTIGPVRAPESHMAWRGAQPASPCSACLRPGRCESFTWAWQHWPASKPAHFGNAAKKLRHRRARHSRAVQGQYGCLAVVESAGCCKSSLEHLN